MWKPALAFMPCMLFLSSAGPAVSDGSQASPPLPAGQQPVRPSARPVFPQVAGTIRAAVVRSWGGGTASAWGELGTEWPQHGSIPILIDLALGQIPAVSYENLVSTGADVVILSDAAGGLVQFTPAEVLAVQRYAEEGHNVIATYKTFRWNGIDNSSLAPIFGLRADLPYTDSEIFSLSNDFHILSGNLLTGGLAMLGPSVIRLPNLWHSSGYASSEVPGDDLSWDPADFAGARAIAQCDGRRGIITVYKATRYFGFFISNMPEYGGSFLDKQLLYNAIVYPRPGG